MMGFAQKLPVDFDGLAFGPDADVLALRDLICGQRGGTVKHVRRETLSDVFCRIAQVAQRVVATRSLLDFELSGGVRGGSAYRFRPGGHGFGPTAFQAGTKFSTDLGTLESGRDYTLLFQLRLPKCNENETEVGRIVLRVPGLGGPQVFEQLVSIPRHLGANPEPDPVVTQAMQIVQSLERADPLVELRAFEARLKLYEAERRDPELITVIKKAIAILHRGGSLDELTQMERAALVSHTRTVFVPTAAK